MFLLTDQRLHHCCKECEKYHVLIRVFSPSVITLMVVTKSFFIGPPQLQHWFYAPGDMGLGQKHPHPETIDKQHIRLLWVKTPKNMKF
jgi:hypothetical protein